MRAGTSATALSVALLMLSACGNAFPKGAEAPETNAGAATPQSPRDLCLDGVPRYPRSSIRVNRAVVAPLRRVKKWVLSGGGIDWDEFSASLSPAPLDERVGVCVLTKKDGSKFTIPAGENTPPPVRCVVVIVRPNGEQTLFMMGPLQSMLESTPTSFAGPRFD